jgi:hypothetical protein
VPGPNWKRNVQTRKDVVRHRLTRGVLDHEPVGWVHGLQTSDANPRNDKVDMRSVGCITRHCWASGRRVESCY